MSRIRFAAALIASLAFAVRTASIVAQPREPHVGEGPSGSGAKPVGRERLASWQPVSLSQFERAAQIATLAAEHGMHALSRRAIREALANGPPFDPQAMPGLGQPLSGARISVGRFGFRNSRLSVESLVSQKLQLLNEQWQPGSSAEEIYETVVAVVLPDRRPREIFLYDAPADASTLTSARRSASRQAGFANPLQPVNDWPVNLGRLLVESAVQAGRASELKRRIAALDGQRNADFAASVVLAQLAVVDRRVDIAGGWRQLERLSKHDPPIYAVPLLRALAAVVDGPEMPEPMADWLEAILAEPEAWQRLSPGEGPYLQLLLAQARWQLSQQDANRARENLRRFLRYGASAGSTERLQTLPGLRTRLLLVAREFARAGLLADALDALANYVDASSEGLDEHELPLAPAWLAVRRLLLEELPAEERYQQLLQWTMPLGDRSALRLVGCFVPHDHRPAVFASDLYRSWPQDEISSNFDLLVAAAHDSGRLDDLERRLAAIADAENFERTALDVLLNEALGREDRMQTRVDQLLAAQPAKRPKKPDTKPDKVPDAQSGFNALAAYLLTRTCLRSADLRELGGRLAAFVNSRARPADREVIAHLNFELAAATAREFQLAPQRLARSGFAHWHPVRAGKHWMKPSCVPQWWAAHDEYLRCLTDTAESSLVFDYPLLGSGDLSVDLFREGVWGSIGYGGISVTSYGVSVPPRGIYRDRAAVFPALAIDRTVSPLVKRSLPGDVSRWTLHVEAGKNQVLCNGELIYEIPPPSPAAPWPALYAWSPAQAVFRGFSLSGDWRIPREVALVQGDRLTGWTSGFYGDLDATKAPAMVERASPQRGGASMRPAAPATAPPAVSQGSQPRGRAIRAPSQPAFRIRPVRNQPADQSSRGGWEAKDSVIVGAYLLPPCPTRPSPSRLSYYRALRDGETLRYEFFYQSERTMVHPALDRLAFLLEPDGVRLHWMTDHPEAEPGDLPLENVADELDSRRGPPGLPLVEDDWNRVTLSLADNAVVLTLNGQPIYERKLESANDRLFSFFHYQDQTEARVRNVVLTGDWPERVPAQDELFAPGRTLTDAEQQAQAQLVGAKEFDIKAQRSEEKSE
jgi:hypothetical protein